MKKMLYNLIMRSHRYRCFSSLMIIIYVIGLILFSIPDIQQQVPALKSIVLGSISIFFTLEYVLRLYCCNSESLSRRQWILKPFSIIDMLAITSFLFGSLLHFNLLFLRTLHLLNALPIKEESGTAHALEKLLSALRDKLQELFACLGLLINLLIIASCALYCFEHKVQPDQFGSIPAALWWAVSTVSTVGYGDVYPITVGGKICAGIFAIIGFGFIALPAAIMTNAYIEAGKNKHKNCPHCGESLTKQKGESYDSCKKL